VNIWECTESSRNRLILIDLTINVHPPSNDMDIGGREIVMSYLRKNRRVFTYENSLMEFDFTRVLRMRISSV